MLLFCFDVCNCFYAVRCVFFVASTYCRNWHYLKQGGRNTSIWVLTSFVFLTSFRFMSSFAFLNFFVGLTSLDFELFWCLMLFVLFCYLTSLVLCTLSKKCVRLLTFFIGTFSSLSTFAFKFILSLCFVFSWNYFRYCYDTIFGLLFWLAEHREGGGGC